MGISRRTLALSLLLVPLARAAPFKSSPPPEASELLRSALEDVKPAYQGKIMITRWFGKQTRAEEVAVYHSAPQRFRWEFLIPSGSIGRVVVSDGSREQLRLASKNKTLQGSAPKIYPKVMSIESERELLLKNYRIHYLGADEVAGRAVWVLELEPARSGKPHQRLWIDQETRVILENKRFRSGAHSATLSRFTRFEPKKDIPDDLFNCAASSGTIDAHGLDPDFFSLEEMEQSTGKASKYPRELPGDFTFESADFFEVKNQTVWHIRYTDGLTTVSLFDTPRPVRLSGTANDSSASLSLPGSLHLSSSGRILHWKQKKTYYTLVADLPRELLEPIAARLKRF